MVNAGVKTVFALLVVATMTACGSQAQRMQEKTAQESVAVGKTAKVPYIEAKNYFVKRGAVLPEDGKVNTQLEFENLFGMAAVMGDDGRPTEIDFERQFVIALTVPPSRQDIEIDDEELLDDGKTLTLEYSIDRDEEVRSYESQPLLIVVVDRKYERENIVLRQVKD